LEPSDAVVLFGVTGDLAYRKIFPALLALAERGRLNVPVIGVARAGWDLERLRARARQSAADFVANVDPKALERVTAALRYVDGDYNDPETFTRLCASLAGARHPLCYLAIPPSMFPTVLNNLGKSGCSNGARVIVEKPFGRDLESAVELNRLLRD